MVVAAVSDCKCVLIFTFKIAVSSKERDDGWWPLFLGTVEAWKEDVDSLQILARQPEIGMRTTK